MPDPRLGADAAGGVGRPRADGSPTLGAASRRAKVGAGPMPWMAAFTAILAGAWLDRRPGPLRRPARPGPGRGGCRGDAPARRPWGRTRGPPTLPVARLQPCPPLGGTDLHRVRAGARRRLLWWSPETGRSPASPRSARASRPPSRFRATFISSHGAAEGSGKPALSPVSPPSMSSRGRGAAPSMLACGSPALSGDPGCAGPARRAARATAFAGRGRPNLGCEACVTAARRAPAALRPRPPARPPRRARSASARVWRS